MLCCSRKVMKHWNKFWDKMTKCLDSFLYMWSAWSLRKSKTIKHPWQHHIFMRLINRILFPRGTDSEAKRQCEPSRQWRFETYLYTLFCVGALEVGWSFFIPLILICVTSHFYLSQGINKALAYYSSCLPSASYFPSLQLLISLVKTRFLIKIVLSSVTPCYLSKILIIWIQKKAFTW